MPRPLTFIRAAETWVPNADASELVAAANPFDSAARLEYLGGRKSFRHGEGLPGQAWAQGRPVLMPALAASFFERAKEAETAGITCAVAVPVYLGGTLKAVLVLFCGHLAGRPGALELWQAGAGVEGAITLVDGAYGEGSAVFEAASRGTVLDRGDGLPGTAWQRGDVQFIEDVSAESRRFRRAEQAADAGMKRGLGIPFGSTFEGGYVVAVLAGADLPIALGFERWELDGGKRMMVRSYAYSERRGGRSTALVEEPLHTADGGTPNGPIAAAFATGLPTIADVAACGPAAAAASAVGASSLLAIPVVWGGSLIRSVAVLYL